MLYNTDLLERGRTTGVSGRLLCNPAMRQAIADAEREELEREQREKELKNTADKPGESSHTSALV